MTLAPNRGIALAALAALAFHALLFLAAPPSGGNGVEGILVAPKTHYLVQLEQSLSMTGSDIRTVKSPVVFSLPSGVGFSRALLENDVATPLNTFSRPEQSESFLEVDPEPLAEQDQLVPRALMLTGGEPGAPSVPSDDYQTVAEHPSANRVTIAPELRNRLLGGVVLPPVLNQEVEKPWEAKALISVSEAGTVEHVFLEKPLGQVQLNQEVLQLLYGLRFKAGESAEGEIGIYSPESKGNGGVEE